MERYTWQDFEHYIDLKTPETELLKNKYLFSELCKLYRNADFTVYKKLNYDKYVEIIKKKRADKKQENTSKTIAFKRTAKLQKKQAEKLFALLIKDKFIMATETYIETFLYVFCGGNKPIILEQIQWIKEKQLLAYFARQFCVQFTTNEYKKNKNEKVVDWKVFELLFGKKNLRQDATDPARPTKDHKNIESIIKTISSMKK